MSATIPSANTGASPTGSTATTSTSTSKPATSTSTGNALTASSFRASTRQRVAEAPDFDPEAVSSSDDSADLSSNADSDVNVDASEPELETDVEEGEPVEEDFSWLEDLKQYKQLHGLDVKDILQALSEGQLPDALQDIIKVKLKNGDQEWESPISKARREAMLHYDYTQKLQALSAEREEYNTDKNEFIEMLQGWKGNPDALLAGLERLEFPVLEAAKLLAKRHQELAEMTPREREFYEKNQALERQIAKEKFEQRRLEQTKGKERATADGEKMADFVSTTAKGLFEKSKIPLDDKTFNLFLSKFKIIAGANPNSQWDEQMVSDAFEATAHVYREAYGHREQAQAAANKAPAQKPLVQQEFTSPAREQVAKLKQQTPAKRPGQKGGKMTSSEFRKLALGR